MNGEIGVFRVRWHGAPYEGTPQETSAWTPWPETFQVYVEDDATSQTTPALQANQAKRMAQLHKRLAADGYRLRGMAEDGFQEWVRDPGIKVKPKIRRLVLRRANETNQVHRWSPPHW